MDSRIIVRRPITASMRNSRGAGPRTLEGKARSRGNALKHGLTAKTLLLPHESPEAYEEFRSCVLAEFAPQGILESQFAEIIANLLWRMKRIPEFEAALFNWSQHFEAVQEKGNASFDSYFLDPSDKRPPKRSAGGGKNTESQAEDARRQTLAYGRALDGMLTEGIFDKLSRYEASLQRQLKQAMQTLFDLQAQRAELCPEQSEIEAVTEGGKAVAEEGETLPKEVKEACEAMSAPQNVTAVAEAKQPSAAQATDQAPEAGPASQGPRSTSDVGAARPAQASRVSTLQPFLGNRGAQSRPLRMAEPAGGHPGTGGVRQKGST